MLRFDNWEFDSVSCTLTNQHKSIRLEPTVSRLLEYLIQNQNRVISRSELIEKVWFNTIVSDDPINRCISILRQSLNQDETRVYIKTIPRRGYSATFPEAESVNSSVRKIGPINRPKTYVLLTFFVVLVGLALNYDLPSNRASPVETPSLAVLPFTDLSEAQTLQYFSEGISDTLIHMFATVDSLEVTARTSSFAFKGKSLTAAQIADELKVEYILEGSVLLQDERIKVLTRLIDSRTQKQIWSQQFKRSIDDLYSVQETIAREVLGALNGTVFEPNQGYQPQGQTYQLVLRGIDALDAMTLESVTEAERIFRQAITNEPNYPLPHVLLAETLKTKFDIDTYRHIYPNEAQLASLQEVEKLIEFALILDPLSSKANNLHAMMLEREGKMLAAGEALQLAIKLQPNNADAISDYSKWLQQMGRVEEAVVQARKASNLSPKSSRINQILAQNLWAAGRSEEAVLVIEKDVKERPDAANNYSLLSRWSLQLGLPGKAMLYAIKEHQLDPKNPNRHWGVCLIHFQLWNFEKGRECSRDLLQQFPDYYEAKVWHKGLVNIVDPAVIENQIKLYPASPYYRLQYADWLTINLRYEEAIDILYPLFPQLFEQVPQVNDWSLWATKMVSIALQGTGKHEQAEKLLKAGIKHVEKSRKLQSGGFSTGVDDAVFLVLLGEYDEALTRLQAAIDSNWSMYSMILVEDPMFKPVYENPRFTQMVDQHRKFLKEQESWYLKQLETELAPTRMENE